MISPPVHEPIDDPDSEACLSNLLQVRLDQLAYVGPGLTIVHFDGRFRDKDVIPANAEVMVSVLLDTGALCANYISEYKYQEMRDNNIIHDHNIIRQRTSIGLADNATKMYSDIMVELPIQLQGSDGKWWTYDGTYVVLDMK